MINKNFKIYLGVSLMALYCLFPIYFLLLYSFEPSEAAYHSPPVFYPIGFTFENYIGVFKSIPLVRYAINSLIVSFSATFLTLLFGSMAAYGVSVLNFKGKELFLNSLILLGFFPAATMIFPIYKMFSDLNLLNNYLALILPYTVAGLPLTTWVMATYFENVPKDLIDAASVDGLSLGGTYAKIMIPLSLPALSTVAILNFIAFWNEFIYALTFMPDSNMRTVTVGISLISGRFVFQFPWGQIIAAALMVTIPLVVMVFVAQEKIISGLTAGAVKG